MLVNGGLQMESPDAEGRQVMHWAAINENTSVLDALLSACIGYDDLLASLLSQADSHGLSPMHWAVYHGNTAAARMLIVAGAQVAWSPHRGVAHLPALRSRRTSRFGLLRVPSSIGLVRAPSDSNMPKSLAGRHTQRHWIQREAGCFGAT